VRQRLDPKFSHFFKENVWDGGVVGGRLREQDASYSVSFGLDAKQDGLATRVGVGEAVDLVDVEFIVVEEDLLLRAEELVVHYYEVGGVSAFLEVCDLVYYGVCTIPWHIVCFLVNGFVRYIPINSVPGHKGLIASVEMGRLG